jgi:hypothetical protein
VSRLDCRGALHGRRLLLLREAVLRPVLLLPVLVLLHALLLSVMGGAH